jgi:hypothetical protein
MKIETKFNPGEYVFFLNGTKLQRDKIHSLTVNIDSDFEFRTSYFFFDEQKNCTMKRENELFATKEDFLDQLDDSEVKEELRMFLNGIG